MSSYATFVYEDRGINWTTSDRNGRINGLGGRPALAGFDSRDGTVFNLPGSGTASVVNLTTTSNVGVPGVFVFRISGSVIMNGMSE